MVRVEYTGALTSRQERVLFTLCRQYIVTGKPVSSSALSRVAGLRWSSATIRNELMVLEQAGLLEQPHHSAGRLPSAAGMAAYVRSIQTVREPPAELRRVVDVALSTRVQGPGDLRAAVHVLSQLIGCVAVTFVGDQRRGAIEALDLVPVYGRSCALVALHLEGGATSVKTVGLDDGLIASADAEALTRLQERLRWLCVGKTLDDARRDLTRLVEREEARVDRMLAAALRIGLWMCSVAALDPLWVQVAGQQILAAHAHADGETFAHVLGLLEDYHRLAAVLCQMLPEVEDRPRAAVHVGAALIEPVGSLTSASRTCVLSGLSLVGCRLPTTVGARPITAAVAMLGSDRMDYERVIPLVEYAAQAMAARTGD